MDDIRYFRPISLIGSVYKSIAETFFSQVGKALNVYVGGRNILNASLTTNECTEDRVRSNMSRVCANWTLKTHIIMCFRIFFCTCWIGWGLGGEVG